MRTQTFVFMVEVRAQNCMFIVEKAKNCFFMVARSKNGMFMAEMRAKRFVTEMRRKGFFGGSVENYEVFVCG